MLYQRSGRTVDTVIDINPAKQGKFLPATGLKVLSPQQAMIDLPSATIIYVMNSNYLAEIKYMVGDQFRCVAIDRIN